MIRSTIADNIPEMPNLSYLNIHYSRKNDTADNRHRPYFVVNGKTKKAYWVRPELRVLQKRGIIEANAREGKTALMQHIKTNQIELVPRCSELGELVIPKNENSESLK